MTSTFNVRCPASPERVKSLRHALRAFLTVYDVDGSWLDDVLTAVGEALINVVEHAYASGSTAELELSARLEPDALVVDVVDEGVFVERESREGRGFGLRIARAIARDVSIHTNGGTRVHMTFPRTPTARSA